MVPQHIGPGKVVAAWVAGIFLGARIKFF